MDFLPDSNVLINFFSGLEPDCGFLSKLLQKNKLHLSVIVIAEILSKATPKEKNDLQELCSIGKIETIGENTAVLAGEYRYGYRNKTKKVYLLDCLLAATCKETSTTLITNNTSDYPMRDIKVIKPS